jgi:ABC-2 type transport system ATP-binding protein
MPAPRPPAIRVTGLRKSFGALTVLDGIDLTVPAGTVLALLGPNGAGKSTTVNILSTLVRADAGTAEVDGHDVAASPDDVRAAIGVTGQFSAVDTLLTAQENLRLMADLHHLPRVEGRARADALLERFELSDAADKPVAGFSGGMQRKLDLAMTLMGDPSVIFLDEPTTGLDPRSRRAMWDVVRGLVADGVTVLLTTQYLEEADQLAHVVAVLDGGRIVAEGTPAELKRRVTGGSIRLRLADAATMAAAAVVFPGSVRNDDGLTLSIPGTGDVAAVRDVLDRLDRSAVVAEHLDVTSPDLDDVFLALTGPTAREAASR